MCTPPRVNAASLGRPAVGWDLWMFLPRKIAETAHHAATHAACLQSAQDQRYRPPGQVDVSKSVRRPEHLLWGPLLSAMFGAGIRMQVHLNLPVSFSGVFDMFLA